MRSDSGYVVREAHCYADGLFDQLTPVLSVPKAYHITVEPSQDECWIWLEDVGEHAFQRMWTLPTLEKAMRGIAHLHAQWWERTAELERLSFLFPRGLALYQGHYTEQFKKVFAAMDSHREAAAISKVYTAERRDLLLKLQDIEDVVYPELDGLPQTLLHQDFIPPNVAFVDERMTLIDWAYAGPGTPGAELCVVSFLADMDLVLEDTIPNLDELLVETLWQALRKEHTLPIRFADVQRGYQLSYVLRTSSLFTLAAFMGFLLGHTVPGERLELSNVEGWLQRSEAVQERVGFPGNLSEQGPNASVKSQLKRFHVSC